MFIFTIEVSTTYYYGYSFARCLAMPFPRETVCLRFGNCNFARSSQPPLCGGALPLQDPRARVEGSDSEPARADRTNSQVLLAGASATVIACFGVCPAEAGPRERIAGAPIQLACSRPRAYPSAARIRVRPRCHSSGHIC